MKSLLKKFALLVIICTTASTAFAQECPKRERDDKRPGQERFMKNIAEQRDRFLTKSLELTEEQQKSFLPMYNEMKEKIQEAHAALKEDLKEVGKKCEEITDEQYKKATKAMIEINAKVSEIELEYYTNKFSKELSAKQLFKLKDSEEKFMRKMLENHRQGGRPQGGAPQGGR